MRFDWREGRERRLYAYSLSDLPAAAPVYDVQTIVPIVPSDVLASIRKRIRTRSSLGRFFTLFEVEEWKPVPPVDSALLEHIGGDLYAVLATWDLTDLERAVIAGTR